MVTMKAIDYNVLMSLIDFFKTNLPDAAAEYNYTGKSIEIYPAYPKDLTKFNRPSIIIQKIRSDRNRIAFGNVMGQYEDVDGTLYDVKGIFHKMMYQINIEGISNGNRDLLSDIIIEGILEKTRHPDIDYDIPLNDYTSDPNSPVLMGRIDIINDIDVIPVGSNDNDEYINMVIIDFAVVQTSIPQVPMVDLYKGIKISQIINL